MPESQNFRTYNINIYSFTRKHMQQKIISVLLGLLLVLVLDPIEPLDSPSLHLFKTGGRCGFRLLNAAFLAAAAARLRLRDRITVAVVPLVCPGCPKGVAAFHSHRKEKEITKQVVKERRWRFFFSCWLGWICSLKERNGVQIIYRERASTLNI